MLYLIRIIGKRIQHVC